MTNTNLSQLFTDALLASLEETFENANTIFLNPNTSFFETLATISAEEASQPVSASCASIAAQVEHVNFFMELLLQNAKGKFPEVDWEHIWNTVQQVTEEEWQDSQQRLRKTYQDIRELVTSTAWEHPDIVLSAMGLLMHNAYHLGEIRQALCTIQNRA